MLDDKTVSLILPIIVLAEVFDIVRKQRTAIPNVATFLNRVSSDPRFEIEPLTFDILLESQNALLVPEMHDRFITATALSLEKQGFQVAVVTKDPDIAALNLVRIIW